MKRDTEEERRKRRFLYKRKMAKNIWKNGKSHLKRIDVLNWKSHCWVSKFFC